MPRHATEPILGVAVVGLAAVHDSVPVAAVDGLDFLADLVRLVEEIVPQPEGRKETVSRVTIDTVFAAERSLHRERFKPRTQSLVWRPGTKWWNVIGDQPAKQRAVLHWVERMHNTLLLALGRNPPVPGNRPLVGRP